MRQTEFYEIIPTLSPVWIIRDILWINVDRHGQNIDIVKSS